MAKTQSRFCLSWDAHQKYICTGLSSLQQNGEFVDMTLAADGHHVKVHQVIIALASPYIKELISSAQCQHPVIFLNKISHLTLCSILEYIYTGEVLVSIENLKELVEAGKELRIKGLEDMNLDRPFTTQPFSYNKAPMSMEEELDDESCYFEITETNQKTAFPVENIIIGDIRTDNNITDHIEEVVFEDRIHDDTTIVEQDVQLDQNVKLEDRTSTPNVCAMQYTVSNQGSLQMILNRFVYYLKHTNRSNTRHWRCVDYLASSRCPAVVVTQNDMVVQRISSHTHAFHDKKILKKIRDGAIYSAIQEAELEGQTKRSKPAPSANEAPEIE